MPNVKVLSLCSGVGVTDMCFVKSGLEPIVANDINTRSLDVYKANHVVGKANPPTIVPGDLTSEITKMAIISEAVRKLNNQPLDILTSFLPTPIKKRLVKDKKELNKEELNKEEFLTKICLNIKDIATALNAKIIFFDSLFEKSYSPFSFEKLENIFNKDNQYHIFIRKHNLQEFGVPNNSGRQPVFFINKEFFDDSLLIQINKIFNSLSLEKAPTVNELLSIIKQIKSQKGKDNLPLQHKIMPLDKQNEDVKYLLSELSRLKAGESLYRFNEFIKATSALPARRVDGNDPFPKSLSGRACEDWKWLLHPTKSRGFTPLELAYFASFYTIPFEFSPDDKNVSYYLLIQDISNATSPHYLLKIINEIIIPLLSLKETITLKENPLEELNYFSSCMIDDKKYYLPSQFGFKPRKVKDFIPNFFSKYVVRKNPEECVNKDTPLNRVASLNNEITHIKTTSNASPKLATDNPKIVIMPPVSFATSPLSLFSSKLSNNPIRNNEKGNTINNKLILPVNESIPALSNNTITHIETSGNALKRKDSETSFPNPPVKRTRPTLLKDTLSSASHLFEVLKMMLKNPLEEVQYNNNDYDEANKLTPDMRNKLKALGFKTVKKRNKDNFIITLINPNLFEKWLQDNNLDTAPPVPINDPEIAVIPPVHFATSPFTLFSSKLPNNPTQINKVDGADCKSSICLFKGFDA